MSLLDPAEPTEFDEPSELANPVVPAPPAATLASRRPGHAAMTHLLSVLDVRSPGHSANTVPSDLSSWYVGVVGEQLVGQELGLLPASWRVLHAVPAGQKGADIDHLLIGPGGVFVLNTKHHAGKTVRVGSHVVWINGFQQAGYQRELLKRSAQVAAAIKDVDVPDIPVLPLLVFVGARQVTLAGDQTVASVQLSGLVRYLISLPMILDEGCVAGITAVAEQPTTWGASTAAISEPDPTLRFLSLRLEGPAVPAASERPVDRVPQRTSNPRRGPAGPARRVLSWAAALGLSLLVLPAAVAVIVTLLGAVFRALIGS